MPLELGALTAVPPDAPVAPKVVMVPVPLLLVGVRLLLPVAVLAAHPAQQADSKRAEPAHPPSRQPRIVRRAAPRWTSFSGA